MPIETRAAYDAAKLRANALSAAPAGSEAADELAALIAEIRQWQERHEGQEAHGPEPVEGFIGPDDLPVSGLPGNLGKLRDD